MSPHPATRPRELSGELRVTGRLVTASNATFLASVDTADGEVQVVYKPVRGERELWDFPVGTLGHREVAAYRLSAAGGFDVVPYTTTVDGPFGRGSAQLWVEAADTDDLVDVAPPDRVPDGWHPVLYGEDEDADLVVVAHADDPRLRRLAVFDALVNNADRKAGHLLVDDGHVLGCDHGVSLHVDDKLRTLLWGWAGEPLSDEETVMVRRAVDAVTTVTELVSAEEIEALAARAERLVHDGLPRPRAGGPAVPWPLW